MNKTLIKSSTNRKIGSKKIAKYNSDLKEFTLQFNTHHIHQGWGDSQIKEVKAKELFKIRFDSIYSQLLNLIEEL
jgi:hypothetical protein